mmetsp:Transcript_19535/g.46958  ORF Transcript_19535/g.46958 Transcript_19535/m.46958 type:complete len:240 (+) Transcript_19535:2117-2836(+)
MLHAVHPGCASSWVRTLDRRRPPRLHPRLVSRRPHARHVPGVHHGRRCAALRRPRAHAHARILLLGDLSRFLKLLLRSIERGLRVLQGSDGGELLELGGHVGRAEAADRGDELLAFLDHGHHSLLTLKDPLVHSGQGRLGVPLLLLLLLHHLLLMLLLRDDHPSARRRRAVVQTGALRGGEGRPVVDALMQHALARVVVGCCALLLRDNLLALGLHLRLLLLLLQEEDGRSLHRCLLLR